MWVLHYMHMAQKWALGLLMWPLLQGVACRPRGTGTIILFWFDFISFFHDIQFSVIQLALLVTAGRHSILSIKIVISMEMALFQSWFMEGILNISYSMEIMQKHTESNHNPRALCTHGEFLKLPQPLTEILMTASSLHSGLQPNFPRNACSGYPPLNPIFSMIWLSSHLDCRG